MGYGDEILAAGQAERIHRTTGRRVLITDLHGRGRWHDIWAGNPVIVDPRRDSATAINHAVRLINAPNARPYIVYPFTPDTGWTFNRSFRARDHVATIYLTDSERQFAAAVVDRLGPFVLIEPWSKHENLRWPLSHWQTLVAARPDLVFVQHVSGEAPLITAPNVCHIQTTFRQAVALCVRALVYIRGESGMLHACAAIGGRSIAIWGGCMDWDVLGGYPQETPVGIVTPPCGRWKPCAHCAQIMAGILPAHVVDALDETLTAIGVK